MSEAQQGGRPGRYERSFGGLIGSMIVLVIAVLAIVVIRSQFRDTPEYDPEPIDYLALVSTLQESGLSPAYPADLPDGWFVKDATFTPGDRPVLDLAMTTDGGHFAGLHEEDASVNELIDTFVDSNATEGDEVEIPGSVAPTWQTFSDEGGDHAFVAEVDGQTVLVYGSASEDELRGLVESLTTESLSS